MTAESPTLRAIVRVRGVEARELRATHSQGQLNSKKKRACVHKHRRESAALGYSRGLLDFAEREERRTVRTRSIDVGDRTRTRRSGYGRTTE